MVTVLRQNTAHVKVKDSTRLSHAMDSSKDIELKTLIEEEETTAFTSEAIDSLEEKDEPIPSFRNRRSFLLHRLRSYRPLAAFVVFMALLLDTTLTTAVVPLLPDLLPNISKISTGTILASKAFFQLVSAFGAGPLTDRVGFASPLVAGFVLLTSATLIIAFAVELGNSTVGIYTVIFVSRSLEGIGCSLASTAGMALIADRYPDDEERGRIMGRVIGGIGLGVVLGYPFGGAFSGIPGGVEAGWKYPFLILALVGLIDLVLQLLILGYREKKKERIESEENDKKKVSAPSMWTLIKDPYVLLGFIVLTMSQLPVAVTEPLVPSWMETNFLPKPKPYSIGLVLLSLTISYMIVAPLVGKVHGKHRWIGVLLGMIIMIIGLCTLPLAALPQRNNIYYSIVPLFLMGVGIGLTDSLMYPTMGALADLRHSSAYGGMYALTDIAVNIGFVIGPLYSSGIDQLVNFNWAMWSVGIIAVLCCPFIAFLKSPTPKK
ncbi:chromaffin granule amine transporter-like [Oscarella lobularis]|uniref:chromaffin granule amine transporter-like n=1 Tax=Oscarella lobularis TaxID=121494 RepID=UPI0033136785